MNNMRASKAVKPLYRSDHDQKEGSSHSPNIRTRLTKFVNQSHQETFIKQENQKSQSKGDRLNLTQHHNFNRNHREQLGRTFSYSNKYNHNNKHNDFVSIIPDNDNKNDEQDDTVDDYNIAKKIDDKLFNPFSNKQPITSTVVNVKFNQQQIHQKYIRKNNTSNNRNQSVISNTTFPRPPSKSVQYNSKNDKFQQQPTDQISNQDNQEKMTHKFSSMRKNVSISTNKPIETYFWLKDPTRKFMWSQKQKPFDIAFSTFKQKIYDKKVRVSNQKSKCNQEWNEYLNKCYLNIKKVKPLMKCDSSNVNELEQNSNQTNNNGNECNSVFGQRNRRQAKSSAEMLLIEIKKAQRQTNHQIQIKINSFHKAQHQNIQTQNEDRPRSTTIMASSKTASLLSNKITHPLSPQKNHKNPHLQQIQIDILTKRINTNRKDHFVFSMGDSNNSNKNQNPNFIRFHLYKDFLWKVNFSNLIHVKMPDDIQKPYKFFVGRGNNAALIKGIMRRRYWWQMVDKISTQVNFVWTQLKIKDFVKSQKTRKSQQLKLLIDQNQSKNNQHSISPQLFPRELQQTYLMNRKIFKGKDLSLWMEHCKENFKHQQKHAQEIGFNILQKRLKSMVRKKKLTFWDFSQTIQQKTHNHFECNYFIGNKKALFYAMRKYYKLYGFDPFNFIPLTFHISGGLQDSEFNEFLEKYNQINEERMRNKSSDLRNIWIVKPGEVTNRGRGITVCATLDEIKIRLKSKQKNSDGSLRTYILQKYIQKPLLYQKRKFDIRHYMLMTCINGCIKGYWYQEGYIRTTSTEYNIKNCKDLYTHLTNDAIQKNSADYGKFQKGNKISYEDFQKYLCKNYKKGFDFFNEILPSMKRLATDAMRATYSIIEPNRRENNFELFGLDFMLDENMKVYLIECNTNPCLQLSCPLLSKIISGLIQNVFKICIDPIFPPPYDWMTSKKFQMGENALGDMKFEIVFDELCDGMELERVYGCERGLGDKIGKVEQDDEEYEEQEQEKEWLQDGNE